MIVVNMAMLKNFKIKDNNNTNLEFFEYQEGNHLLVLFFRGAWCNHCKKQLQEIQNNLVELNELGVKVLAISSDTKFNSSILKTFLKLEFPVLSDPAFKLINEYGIKTEYKSKEVSKPAIYLYNPKHEEIFKYIGESYDDRISTEDLMNILNELINN